VSVETEWSSTVGSENESGHAALATKKFLGQNEEGILTNAKEREKKRGGFKTIDGWVAGKNLTIRRTWNVRRDREAQKRCRGMMGGAAEWRKTHGERKGGKRNSITNA